MACDLLSRVAKWHVIFCPGWQSGMLSFVQGGKVACNLLSRVAKWHVMVCPGVAKWHVIFCTGWQSGM